MTRKTIKTWLVGLACAGIPLVTAASCETLRGAASFFRDDDSGDYYDDYYYDDYYYDDYYYDDYYYYDDCYDCWKSNGRS